MIVNYCKAAREQHSKTDIKNAEYREAIAEYLKRIRDGYSLNCFEHMAIALVNQPKRNQVVIDVSELKRLCRLENSILFSEESNKK